MYLTSDANWEYLRTAMGERFLSPVIDISCNPGPGLLRHVHFLQYTFSRLDNDRSYLSLSHESICCPFCRRSECCRLPVAPYQFLSLHIFQLVAKKTRDHSSSRYPKASFGIECELSFNPCTIDARPNAPSRFDAPVS